MTEPLPPYTAKGRMCVACIRLRDKERWAKDRLLPRVSRDAANRLGEALG